MEKTQVDSECHQEMDDSGCIQDDMSPYKNGYRQVSLLDLSDDVLLYILKYCSPQDLKALGFTCERLGTLVLERSLWKHVDARTEEFSAAQVQWYLTHTLHDETQELLITGHAKANIGCMGLMKSPRGGAEDDKAQEPKLDPSNGDVDPSGNTIAEDNISVMRESPQANMLRYHARHVSSPRVVCLSRIQGSPEWADARDMGRAGPEGELCIGPQFTVTPQILKQLGALCPNLTTLSLEYCNVNCNFITLNQFPRTIKKLSLRGTRFYNMLVDRSFLSNVNEHLPVLEYIDVSECEWMEPSSLLPLSKHTCLTHLIVRECHRLSEFVAYASLTTRYGFKNLKVIDMRGSPVGDSEVAAMGWLPTLEELWLAAPRRPRVRRHAHYSDDPCVAHAPLRDWELAEPEYFQMKSTPESTETDEPEPSRVATEPTASTSREDEEARLLARRNCLINLASCRINAIRQLARQCEENDDEDGPPKKKVKFDSLDMDIDDIVDAQIPEDAQNEEMPGDMDISPGIMAPNSVIVMSSLRNESHEFMEQNSPVICLCPEHRDVNKTDKATETDHMDIFRQCHCKHSPNPRPEVGESSRSNTEKEDKVETNDTGTDAAGNNDNGIKNNEDNGIKNNDGDGSDNGVNDENAPPGGDNYVLFRRNEHPIIITRPSGRMPGVHVNLFGRGPPQFNPSEENANNQEIRPPEVPFSNRGAYSQFLHVLADYWQSRMYPNVERAQNESTKDNSNNDNAANENSNASTDGASKPLLAPSVGPPGLADRARPSTSNAAHVCIPRGFPGAWAHNRIDNDKLNNDNNTNVNHNEPGGSRSNASIFNEIRAGPSTSNTAADKSKVMNSECDDAKPSTSKMPISDQSTSTQSKPSPSEAMESESINKAEDKDDKTKGENPGDSDNEALPVAEAEPDRRRQNLMDGLLRMQNLRRYSAGNPPSFAPRHGMSPAPPFPIPFPNPDPRRDVQYIVEPRHHVLYVSVGAQLNTYRFPRDTLENDRHSESHIDTSALVTDFAIRRFGRGDGEDANYVLNFGVNGPIMMNPIGSARPDRSNLRVLSVTGYRNITDRSLVHLSIAAPHLRVIDFSETNVTEQGVEKFKAMRPDCEVVYSKFEEEKKK